jgi:hypothetical protein
VEKTRKERNSEKHFRFVYQFFGYKQVSPRKVDLQFQDSAPGVSLPENEKYDIVTGSFDQLSYKQRSVLKVKSLTISDTGGYTCKWIRTKSSVVDVSGSNTITVRSKKGNRYFMLQIKLTRNFVLLKSFSFDLLLS